MTPANRYASFLLRMQWMPNDDQPVWIASIQSTKTGELRWFPSLEALLHFLQAEFGDAMRLSVAEDANETEKNTQDCQAKGRKETHAALSE